MKRIPFDYYTWAILGFDVNKLEFVVRSVYHGWLNEEGDLLVISHSPEHITFSFTWTRGWFTFYKRNGWFITMPTNGNEKGDVQLFLRG
jgi:hypothetical protein